MIKNSNEQVNGNENVILQNSNKHNHLHTDKNAEISNSTVTKKETENKVQLILWLKNKKDLKSIILLIILYIIQGLPFGLSTAIPVSTNFYFF